MLSVVLRPVECIFQAFLPACFTVGRVNVLNEPPAIPAGFLLTPPRLNWCLRI